MQEKLGHSQKKKGRDDPELSSEINSLDQFWTIGFNEETYRLYEDLYIMVARSQVQWEMINRDAETGK